MSWRRGTESGRASLARRSAVESPRRRRLRTNCSPEEMQVMRLRQFFGRADAIASFAHWAWSARASSAGRDATTAAMDDASASAAMKPSISSAVFRASRGAKRLHTFLPSCRAHAAISSLRAISLPTTDSIRITDSCIVNLVFLSAEVPFNGGNPTKQTLQLPYKYLTKL